MAMNDFNIGFLAGLDGTKSKAKLNQDIDAIKKSLKEIELKAKLDPNQVKALENQLNSLKVNLNNVSIDKASLNNLVSQINNSLSGINLQIPNLNTGNIGNQTQQVGKQIGQQIQNGINSVIQKGSFEKIFRASGNGINNVSKDAEKYFKTLSNTVSVQERLGTNNNLTSFTVSLKNAEGVAEQLNYQLRKITDDKGNIIDRYFEYSGGSINDNGVIKQLNTISAKADSLQTKLEKLKSSYSDMNASRPIKDSNNISALSQQYDKVAKSIENVRNADSASFSSMVSNAQREITVLENMVSQFRNAENVATQMKSVDISSGIAQAQERLGKLKANASGFDQMKQTIVDLDTAIANVGDKSSLDAFINKLKVAESQLGRVKAETKQLQDVNKIQLSMGVNGDTTSKIEVLRNNFTKLGLSADEVKTKMSGVDTEVKTLQSLMNSGADNSAIVTQFEKLQTVLTQTQNNLKQTRSDYSLLATEQQRLSLANTIEAWNQKNTRATKEVRAENDRYVASLRDLNTQMTKLQFGQIQTGFKQSENSMRTLNRLGASLKDQMKQAANSFTQWISVSSAIMGVVYSTKEAVQELKEVDNILTEISKTSDMTSQELEKLGMSSYSSASKYGRTATDYLTGVQEMSRSGFYGEKGTAMAEQSLLAQSAGDMTSELANSYILATNAAYKFNGEASKINAVLDGQNSITNKNSVAMADMATAMTKAGTVASSYNVSIEDLSAMIGTMESVTKLGGEEVGTGIKSILINLQNISSSKITGTLDKANASMTEMKNGIEQLRNPIEILRDLAKTFNDLDEKDPLRAEILTNIGGKYQATKLAALLQNMDMFDKMLVDYSQGSGSAMEEASKSANNLQGRLNALSNSWTEFVNSVVQSDTLKTGVNILNELVQGVTKLTSSLGSLGTIGLGAGLFAGIKNIGKTYKCTDFKIIC